MKKAVRAAGLDDRLHFHSARHAFASWLVRAGVSLYEVQKLLGHSSPTVTEVYSHLQPEHLHGRVNKITVSMN
jgi:site-specific recombinase XerD